MGLPQISATDLEPYRDRVARIAHLMLSDSCDASRVTTETFSKLARSTHALAGDCSLRILVFRSAVSTIRSRQRWWNRRGLRSSPDSANDEAAAVRYGLRCLPLRYRLVLALRDIEGLSYREISEVLGLSNETVKSRLRRARSLMLTSMNEATFLCAARTLLQFRSTEDPVTYKMVLRGFEILLLIVVLCATALAAQSDPDRAAVVNGERISLQDVERAAAPELKAIEVRKSQFEIELERDRRVALDNALEGIVRDRLLSAEAKKRKLSVDELLALEVDSAAPKPADEVVVQFYNENKARLEGSLADNAAAIRDYLRGEKRQAVYDAFISDLRKQYGAKTYLEPSRTTIATAGRPSKGPANAPVTIVEFSDFECPFCRALFPTLERIEADYKDKVRVVYLQFPLASLHPNARKAAEASLCAYEQDKFWQLHDAMFSDQQNLTVEDLKKKAAKLSLDTVAFNTCLDGDKYLAEIQSDMEEGVRVGISGTPALFINGRLLVGAQPYGDIQKIIEDELRRSTSDSD
jgi:RNA polymerase sigma factor (sigma-70 family)